MIRLLRKNINIAYPYMTYYDVLKYTDSINSEHKTQSMNIGDGTKGARASELLLSFIEIFKH